MTDRELLELAAKAAGIEHAMCYDAWPEEGFPAAYAKTGKHQYWNPLTDDGDALRLAVKLQLTVCNEHVSAGVVYCTRGEDDVFPEVRSGTSADSDVLPDDYVATRRAIVRAAAAIGEQMP